MSEVHTTNCSFNKVNELKTGVPVGSDLTHILPPGWWMARGEEGGREGRRGSRNAVTVKS